MRPSPLFVAVDVGTSGARAVAFDDHGRRLVECREHYPTTCPAPGRAEQDASAWADCALTALADLVRRTDARRIKAIGLTGQTPTVVPVDEHVRPLRPGMLYRDNRAVTEAAEMVDLFGAAKLHDLTGHVPTAFHVAPKVLWIRRHEPDVFRQTRWFLQPRDVVLQRLVGVVATDETHADATCLFDLRGRRWSRDVLDGLGLSSSIVPEALHPATIVGAVTPDLAARLGLPAAIPVVVGAGDSQCAAYGADVTAPGPVSEMAGSSSCINTAVAEPVADERVTHYSHVVPGVFTTELGLNTTGAAIAWAVETLGFHDFHTFARAADSGRRTVAVATSAAAAVAAAPFFVPHLGDGERDGATTRGGLFGLSDRHGPGEVAYAVIEGVAAAVTGLVTVLREAGCPTDELRVAGGGTRLPTLGQAKADLLGLPVLHLDVDSSPLGAALLAAASAGFEDVADAARRSALERARRHPPEAGFAAHAAARLEAYRRFA